MIFMIISNDPKSLVNFRLDLLKKIVGLGYVVYAVAPNLENSDSAKILIDNNIICRDFYLDRTGMNAVRELKSLFSLYCILKNIKPDHVLGYTIKPAIYGVIIGRIARIVKCHMLISGLGYAFNSYETERKLGYKQRILHYLYGLAIKKSSSVFFQNYDDVDLFKKLNLIMDESNITVVNGSGVNLYKFSMMPLINDENDRPIPSFLMVARLLKDKGIYEYIDAIKRLKSVYPNIKFGLLGSIDLNPLSVTEKELNSWVSEGIVEYHGYTNNVISIVKEYNVLVLPSYREGVPRSLLEGMAMGRAIITTNAPGCKETVIDNVNGFIVDVGSVDGLYKAFLKVVENPEILNQMAIESHNLAKSKFDVDIINNQMSSVMDI